MRARGKLQVAAAMSSFLSAPAARAQVERQRSLQRGNWPLQWRLGTRLTPARREREVVAYGCLDGWLCYVWACRLSGVTALPPPLESNEGEHQRMVRARKQGEALEAYAGAVPDLALVGADDGGEVSSGRGSSRGRSRSRGSAADGGWDASSARGEAGSRSGSMSEKAFSQAGVPDSGDDSDQASETERDPALTAGESAFGVRADGPRDRFGTDGAPLSGTPLDPEVAQLLPLFNLPVLGGPSPAGAAVLDVGALVEEHLCKLLRGGHHPLSLVMQRLCCVTQSLHGPVGLSPYALSPSKAVEVATEDSQRALKQMYTMLSDLPLTLVGVMQSWGAWVAEAVGKVMAVTTAPTVVEACSQWSRLAKKAQACSMGTRDALAVCRRAVHAVFFGAVGKTFAELYVAVGRRWR